MLEHRTPRHWTRVRRKLVAILATGASLAAAGVASAATLPVGFQETVAFSGLTQPTATVFAADGRVFVAEKSGLIKVFASATASGPPTVFADLRTQVDNIWDRGLLGLAVSPAFPADPSVYVLYTYDALPGGTAPQWGAVGVTSDPCPTPPGPTADGCVVTGRLSKLTASAADPSVSTGAEVPLITDWCQQFPSHSIGSLAFGPDGMLYASGGDGASFTNVDFGQYGGSPGSPTAINPCGDGHPGDQVGIAASSPTAEGGALHSQDLATPADPTALNGSIIRIDPATGAAAAGNPLIASADLNARRIVAYGLRNPFRFAFRPGTSEIWAGDVGWGDWEEIDRVQNPLAAPPNFGWPCMEGPGRQGGYEANTLTICQNLYASGTAATPFYTYNHTAKVVAGETCPTGGSSVSGVAFVPTTAASTHYPAALRGALLFADYSRNCIWAMKTGAGGVPDPTKVITLVAGATGPVQLTVSPAGDLYYTDLIGGTIRKIRYAPGDTPPTARISATPLAGSAPLPVGFTATASSDPDPGDVLSYSWDLNGDNIFGDDTTVAPSFTYTQPGTYVASVRVTDLAGQIGTASVTINVGNTPPVPTIASPVVGSTWKVGDTIAFSGSASDAQDGTLAPARLSWALVIRHCAVSNPSSCHAHPGPTFPGVASGSFVTSDHDAPSYLELTLTATDSFGATASVTRRIDPRTVKLALRSAPAGATISAGPTAAVTPYDLTSLEGGTIGVSIASPQTIGSSQYAFASWSDGGAQTHQVTMNVAKTLTANLTLICPGQFKAEYFTNPTLTGTPAVTRCEVAINNDWGDVPPVAGIAKDNYSVRWTRDVTFVAGTYDFTTLSDDGIRLFVDNTAVINNWTDHASTTNTGNRSLTAGVHPVRVEFYEKSGEAIAKASWTLRTPAGCPTGQFKAEYFTNPTLTGAPAVTRCEVAINNDWGDVSPVAGIAKDNYSVRWTGDATFAAGTYDFTTQSDDGIRLFVDNAAVIDNWTDHGVVTNTGSRLLTAGLHTVRVEFYEKTGEAVAKASWALAGGPPPTTCPAGQFKAEYFTNMTLSGTPAVTRCEAAITNDWGTLAPVAGIGADNFSVRWTQDVTFAAGTYGFTTVSDDGMRVFVDNTAVINNWTDHAPVTDTGSRVLSAGVHPVRVEFYENAGGAVAKASWTLSGPPPTCPSGQFKAEYFTNMTLSGTPAVTRCEATINNNWGLLAPVAGIGIDNFSVRWTQDATFTAGSHTFTTESDDGIRVFVDGTPVINNWTDHAQVTDSGSRVLTAGVHTVVVEYYENAEDAVAIVSWI